MAICLGGRESEEKIEVAVNGPGTAKRLFIYTGIAIFNFKGAGSDWLRDYIEFEVGDVFSPGKVVKIVPMAHLNSISNWSTAVNAGWAVDKVSARYDLTNQRIFLRAYLAVRDIDGFIHRIGWTVHVLTQ